MATFGEQLKDMRKENGETLKEVAAALNISPSYLSEIEHDRRTPSEDVLDAMSKHFEVPYVSLAAEARVIDTATERYMKRHPAVYRMLMTMAHFDLDDTKLGRLEMKMAMEIDKL